LWNWAVATSPINHPQFDNALTNNIFSDAVALPLNFASLLCVFSLRASKLAPQRVDLRGASHILVQDRD
jgi:hypothetical protein